MAEVDEVAAADARRLARSLLMSTVLGDDDARASSIANIAMSDPTVIARVLTTLAECAGTWLMAIRGDERGALESLRRMAEMDTVVIGLTDG